MDRLTPISSVTDLPSWVDTLGEGDLFLPDILASLATHVGTPKSSADEPVIPHYLQTMGAQSDRLWRQRLELTTQKLHLEGIRRAVVVMVDGMGAEAVSVYRAYLPFLRSHENEFVSAKTIIPSTTASAITAFTTGGLPAATRMVGWAVADGDKTTDLLSFSNASVSPEDRQQVPTLFQRARSLGVSSAVVNARKFAASGLTRAALRGAQYVGADSLVERVNRAVNTSVGGVDLVYLYWHGLDHAGHGHGPGSQEWLNALEEVDAGLKLLCSQLPADTAVILTADHGMVSSLPDTRIDIASQPHLTTGVKLLAGEGRCIHLHTQTPDDQEVLDRWCESLADRAWMVPRTDLTQVWGPGPGNEDVGAALVFLNDHWTVGDSRTQRTTTLALPGVHGSLTESERSIVAARLK
ncbi:MAG: alkaline phosphatase family protein [Actinomycetaceae bacterium]|nr:alkaline phosphatase family protein [Actinomycetaceae bacterium]